LKSEAHIVKIKLDIETTPQELRTFFGLPDVEPLQKEILDKIRSQMEQGVEGFDPLTLMKPFLPENLRSLETLQQDFWKAWLASAKKAD
jgi:hypothetical protein